MKWDRREKRFLLLYPERGLALSETAAAILQLCDGKRSVDGIVDELVRNSANADLAAVRADVTGFIEEMRRRGLLEG
jgi:pyrroloquinoline quinone biosynthesis protein D